jgi:hypothetical protein
MCGPPRLVSQLTVPTSSPSFSQSSFTPPTPPPTPNRSHCFHFSPPPPPPPPTHPLGTRTCTSSSTAGRSCTAGCTHTGGARGWGVWVGRWGSVSGQAASLPHSLTHVLGRLLLYSIHRRVNTHRWGAGVGQGRVRRCCAARWVCWREEGGWSEGLLLEACTPSKVPRPQDPWTGWGPLDWVGARGLGGGLRTGGRCDPGRHGRCVGAGLPRHGAQGAGRPRPSQDGPCCACSVVQCNAVR